LKLDESGSGAGRSISQRRLECQIEEPDRFLRVGATDLFPPHTLELRANNLPVPNPSLQAFILIFVRRHLRDDSLRDFKPVAIAWNSYVPAKSFANVIGHRICCYGFAVRDRGSSWRGGHSFEPLNDLFPIRVS
jgi:hypothetical protein